MAVRPLTKSETNTLMLKLVLAGYIPGKDFKFDEYGRLLARKEVMHFLQQVPAVPEDDVTEEPLCAS